MNSTPQPTKSKARRTGPARADRAVWGPDTDTSLALVAGQLKAVLEDLDGAELREKIGSDARLYLQCLQLVARISDARVRYERQKAEEAAEREKRRKAQPSRKQGSGIQPETMDRIETELNLF